MKSETIDTARRGFLIASGGVAAAAALPTATTSAAEGMVTRAARSTPPALMPAATREAIRKLIGTANLSRGRITLDLPAVVDNGNVVALAVKVDSPMTEGDHVRAVHVLTEKNPQPNVLSIHFKPQAGVASFATRIRLADTQTVLAIAEMNDGSFWYETADSVVTISACLEEI